MLLGTSGVVVVVVVVARHTRATENRLDGGLWKVYFSNCRVHIDKSLCKKQVPPEVSIITAVQVASASHCVTQEPPF